MIGRRVIKTVAQKHGILLGEDDPILSFLAVHDVILDEYVDRFNCADANQQEKLEKLLNRFAAQTTQAIETAVGRERERFRNDLQSILAMERKANRGGDNTVSIILWRVIGASVFLSLILIFVMFS